MNETIIKQQDSIDYRTTHAYQIPQQSNVGSESIFLTDPPLISSIKRRSAHTDHRRRSKDSKSISCPFYVMYFTNLAIQQHQQNQDDNFDNKENDRIITGNTSSMRKVPVNSRISTVNIKNQRQVHTPISIKTYSTIDDSDERLTNSTSAHLNKRLSRKILSNVNKNSPLLDDLLRTSSWNHVQV